MNEIIETLYRERSKIIEVLEKFHQEQKKMVLTTSFQSTSAVLLHIASYSKLPIDVVFIDTGYHFPETIKYMNTLARLLDIKPIVITSSISHIHQRQPDGTFLYAKNPERCCYINKVMPFQIILPKYNVWISGVRNVETEWRKNIKQFEKTPEGILRYHPILFWSDDMVKEYIKIFNLPYHPLDKGELRSIGCEPCTYLYAGKDRTSRWFGSSKKECGLHTYLIKK